MNMNKSESVQTFAEDLYKTLRSQGVDVIFDDRKERPGVMFADMELIGVPHMVVIGEKNLENGEIEYKNRRTGEKQMIAKDQLLDFLKGRINQ
ncbi:His/Gly/Thr/Pro-type tRNA ligase C-terminal domain-containing protein, partial [Glaesserella parasuis]|nr:His/Gly/Thr/Pro-type tRNA ligase C-terminal domain-containing protein [Glaesserella parasuis]